MVRLAGLLSLLLLALCSSAAAGNTTSCILVFGDSTVDPGNNNGLKGAPKADFPPYGKDFFGHRPTGRFCNGRLPTDFIAEQLGISTYVPAFLDPNIRPENLRHGVSFASASSGYDQMTATNAGVLTMSKQIEYLMHYKIHLRSLVGPLKAENIIKNGVVITSAGTNDFIENYYIYPDRAKQFTVEKYQDYLLALLSNYTKEIYRLGGRRFVVVGIPPIGCLPIVKTLADSEKCVDTYNDVSVSFNKKLVSVLANLKTTLGVKTGYADVYTIMLDAANNPSKYGFVEVSKGCCGSGMIEMGDSCKGQTTCKDPSRYMFWDAVHPTEALYKILAENVAKIIASQVLG